MATDLLGDEVRPPIEDEPARVEQGIRVYAVDDGYSFYAGRDFEEAFACALDDWGHVGKREADEDRGTADDTPMNLDTHTVRDGEDGEGPLITFRQHIKQLIECGIAFPTFLCGIDA